VVFVKGIHEMLDLGHLELTYPHQTITRGDLVPETQADLGSSEGQPTSVELNQFVEVDEHALSSLGSQVAHKVGGGTYLSFEHEVEGFRMREFIACFRRFDFEPLNNLTHSLSAQTIHIYEYLFVLLRLRLLQLTLLEFSLQPLPQKFISPVPLSGLDVLDEEVSEPGNVSGVFEDDMGGDAGRIDL
jgi:hypothetical protein